MASKRKAGDTEKRPAPSKKAPQDKAAGFVSTAPYRVAGQTFERSLAQLVHTRNAKRLAR